VLPRWPISPHVEAAERPVDGGGLDMWLADLERRRAELVDAVALARAEVAELEASHAAPSAVQLQVSCVLLEAHQRLETEAQAAAAVIADLTTAGEMEAEAIVAAATTEATRIRLVAARLSSPAPTAGQGARVAIGTGGGGGR
jgi:hypothetical protein